MLLFFGHGLFSPGGEEAPWRVASTTWNSSRCPIKWCNQKVPDCPLLVFDGDCAFCRMWVGYWKTSPAIASNMCRIRQPRPLPRCRRAPSSRRRSSSSKAARATAEPKPSFISMASRPGRRMGALAYRHIPGLAAAHRSALPFHRGASKRRLQSYPRSVGLAASNHPRTRIASRYFRPRHRHSSISSPSSRSAAR